jgi:hypothetical protein
MIFFDFSIIVVYFPQQLIPTESEDNAMLNALLAKLGLGDGSHNADVDTRRKHIRYGAVQADVEVAGKAYSLRDWSMGGFSFETLPDSRLLTGDRINFTLHFRFPHDTISVAQQGRVLRTGRKGVAAEFISISPEARREFVRVIDGIHAQGFLQSQANTDKASEWVGHG